MYCFISRKYIDCKSITKNKTHISVRSDMLEFEQCEIKIEHAEFMISNRTRYQALEEKNDCFFKGKSASVIEDEYCALNGIWRAKITLTLMNVFEGIFFKDFLKKNRSVLVYNLLLKGRGIESLNTYYQLLL